MRISEPSFTDSGIDATGKTENQTCTRVDGRSAPSTLSLPVSPRVVSAFLGRGNQDGSACADAGSPAFVYTLPKSCKRAQRAKACLLWCERQAETNPVRKRAGQDS